MDFQVCREKSQKKRNPENMDIDLFVQLQQRNVYSLDLSCMEMLVSGQRELNIFVKEKVQAESHQAFLPALQGLFFSLLANLLEKRAEYEEIDEFSV